MAPSHSTKKEDPKKQEDVVDLSKYADIIDPETFEQILEMDDDELEHDFSKPIVFGFFDQAEETFGNMTKALEKEDFNDLSQLGHFLKGSSATLGLTKVKDACEKIQHCKEDLPDKENESERRKTIEGIQQTVKDVQVDYREVANVLRRFFGEEPIETNTTTTTTTSNTEDEETKPESPKAAKK